MADTPSNFLTIDPECLIELPFGDPMALQGEPDGRRFAMLGPAGEVVIFDGPRQRGAFELKSMGDRTSQRNAVLHPSCDLLAVTSTRQPGVVDFHDFSGRHLHQTTFNCVGDRTAVGFEPSGAFFFAGVTESGATNQDWVIELVSWAPDTELHHLGDLDAATDRVPLLYAGLHASQGDSVGGWIHLRYCDQSGFSSMLFRTVEGTIEFRSLEEIGNIRMGSVLSSDGSELISVNERPGDFAFIIQKHDTRTFRSDPGKIPWPGNPDRDYDVPWYSVVRAGSDHVIVPSDHNRLRIFDIRQMVPAGELQTRGFEVRTSGELAESGRPRTLRSDLLTSSLMADGLRPCGDYLLALYELGDETAPRTALAFLPLAAIEAELARSTVGNSSR